jgi:dihydropyrimidine dehydrogenase (NAD+) subunit PreA
VHNSATPKTDAGGDSGLRTAFCGLELENPFLLASAPPTRNARMILKGFEAGWAGAVTKTVTAVPPVDPRPRIALVNAGRRSIGTLNIELISTITPRKWQEEIRLVKRNFPRRIVIASIMASLKKNEWTSLARQMEDAGADAIELNISCPHGMPEKAMGSAIGQDPRLAAEVTHWVKTCTGLPVIPKLTPNVTDLRVIATACAKAGADALSGINTVEAICGVDIERIEPLPGVRGRSSTGGYGGGAVKPIALRCVHQMRTASGLPVSAMGGISTWRDAVEFMLLGASNVQLASEVMCRGTDIIHGLVRGLRSYLARKGFTSPAQMVGKAGDLIVAHSELGAAQKTVARVRRSRCNSCGRCIRSCDSGAFEAMTLRRGKAYVDEEKCGGCGLCVWVCPHSAVRMVE